MKNLILFMLIIGLGKISFGQQKNAIGWNDIPLTWNDFTPKENMPDRRTASVVLRTNYGWESKQNHQGTLIEIKSEIILNREASIVQQKFLKEANAIQKDSLLRHEKGHYAIELIKQLWFHDTLSKVQLSSNYKLELRSLFAAVEQKAVQLNADYDKETNHSLNKTAQAFWEVKLMNMLNELNAFSKKLPIKISKEIYLPKSNTQ